MKRPVDNARLRMGGRSCLRAWIERVLCLCGLRDILCLLSMWHVNFLLTSSLGRWWKNGTRRAMMARLAVLVVLVASTVTQAFVWHGPVQRMAATALTARPTTAAIKTAPLRASENEYVVLSEDQERQAAREKIQSMIDNNGVCLFMKGTKLFPMCGFSNTAVQVLRAMEAEFDTFDVLSDPWVRDEIKKFSNWPTIPQVYIGGEFVGGSDILLELYESGELKEILDKAKKA